MEQMNNKQQLAEDYGKTWLGSDIAWAAAQSGFIAGWEACQQNLQQTPCTALLPDECKHEKSYYCFKTGGGRCRKCQKLIGQ